MKYRDLLKDVAKKNEENRRVKRFAFLIRFATTVKNRFFTIFHADNKS